MKDRLNIPRPSGGQRVWGINPIFLEGDLTGGLPIGFGDTPAIDAFGRLRVSNPFTLFESKQTLDKQPLFWDEDITNNSGTATATHSTIEARTRMEVGNSDTIVRQTFEHFNYQPGKSQLIFLTTNFLGGDTDVVKRVGIFTDTNGMFFELNGETMRCVIRKNGEDRPRNQVDWNKDKFDGEGLSGLTLDLNRIQILLIDFEWLAAGRVRFGFVVGGVPYYVHEFYHANLISTVYTSLPNLPVRFEIAAGAAGAGALDHICSTVISEGGQNPRGGLFGVDSGAKVTLASQNTVYGMLAIRLRDGYESMATAIESFTAISSSAGEFYLRLYLNPTLAGGSWSWNNVNATYSGMEYADGGNGVTINGGIVLYSAIISGRESVIGDVNNKRNLGVALDGTKDIIAIAIVPLTNNQDCAATINWREE